MNRPAPGEASQQLERSVTTLLTWLRVAGVAQFVADGWSDPTARKRRWPLGVGFGALAFQSGAAIRRRSRAPFAGDETQAWLDTGAGIVGLVADLGARGTRGRAAGPHSSDYTVTAAMCSAASTANPTTELLRGLCLAAATALTTLGPGTNIAGLMSELLTTANGYVGYPAIARLRREATTLDLARQHDVAAAEREEAQAERRRQHRLLHDSALQLLEVVAGGWPLDDSALHDRLLYEADRLTSYTEASSAETHLPTCFNGLRDAFAHQGLIVHLNIDHDVSLASPTLGAVRGAAHEVLTNIVKHAKTTEATITTLVASDRISIIIEDEGRGFEPTTRPRGYGLSQSVEARVAEIGATVDITSQPGVGTRVTITIPQ
jgi:signal transduction histidine kinase